MSPEKKRDPRKASSALSIESCPISIFLWTNVDKTGTQYKDFYEARLLNLDVPQSLLWRLSSSQTILTELPMRHCCSQCSNRRIYRFVLRRRSHSTVFARLRTRIVGTQHTPLPSLLGLFEVVHAGPNTPVSVWTCPCRRQESFTSMAVPRIGGFRASFVHCGGPSSPNEPFRASVVCSITRCARSAGVLPVTE